MLGNAAIASHYSPTNLVARFTEALQDAGLNNGDLSPADLAPLDQFHTRGLAAIWWRGGPG